MYKDPEAIRLQVVASHMLNLLQSPEWGALEREIKDMEGRLVESLVTQVNHVEHLQGVILGVRKVLALPAYLISRGKGN